MDSQIVKHFRGIFSRDNFLPETITITNHTTGRINQVNKLKISFKMIERLSIKPEISPTLTEFIDFQQRHQ